MNITGEVWIDACMGIERHTVYLTAEQNMGWEVVIDPSVVPFLWAYTVEFTAQVVIPPGIPPGPRELRIHSTLFNPGRAPITSNASCNITVEGYDHISIEAVEPAIYLSDEGKAGHAVFAVNQGTLDAECTFELRLNDEIVAPRGNLSTFIIAAGERRLVRRTLDFSGLVDGPGEVLEIRIISFEVVTTWHSVDLRHLDSDSITTMVWDPRYSYSDSLVDLISVSGYILVLVVLIIAGAVLVLRMGRRDL